MAVANGDMEDLHLFDSMFKEVLDSLYKSFPSDKISSYLKDVSHVMLLKTDLYSSEHLLISIHVYLARIR